MLTSISPVGERTRGQRWWLTATAYVAGSLIGGAVIGSAAGALGRVVLVPLGWSDTIALVTIAAAALVAAGLEVAGVRLPSRRRQVDERWLDRYRGWVYGLGFGVQLGLGVVTIAPSNVMHAALLAAVATAAPVRGLTVGLVFGAVRALPLIVNAGARNPAALRRVMRRVSSLERALPLVTGLALMVAAGGAWVGR